LFFCQKKLEFTFIHLFFFFPTAVFLILNWYLREKRRCPAVIYLFSNVKKMVSVVKRLVSKEGRSNRDNPHM